MSTDALRLRQWVALPQASFDARVGTGIIDEAAQVLKSAVGRPQTCLLVHGASVDSELLERLRCQLTDARFRVHVRALPEGRSLEAGAELLGQLAKAHITADDLVLAVGETNALSLASWACSQWCDGVPLGMVPTTLEAAVEAPASPRGIDVAAVSEALTLKPATKFVLCDLDAMELDPESESSRMARALMLATAMCDSETAFSKLWDRAEALHEGDLEQTAEQLVDTIKSRGKLVSSVALATRQSAGYGRLFARVLASFVRGAAASTCFAEALRFQARLAAGEGKLSVDDMLAQDELLESLGLGYVSCNLDEKELIAALREERFLRSNRFLLELPRSLGMVRLATVSEDLLLEHVAAWCASRRPE